MTLKSVFLCVAAIFATALSTANAMPMTVAATNVPVEICDECTVTSTINVGTSGIISDLNLLLNITHGWDADLVLSLSHGGTTVVLSNRNGGSGGADYIDTLFDDSAADAINVGHAYAPYTGSFRPEQALAAFNGHNIFGLWTLTMTDSEAGDAGTLNNWNLQAEVPEPASLALFGLGFLGVCAVRRRSAAGAPRRSQASLCT